MCAITNLTPSEVLNMNPVEQTFLFDAASERLRNRPTSEFFAKLFGGK